MIKCICYLLSYNRQNLFLKMIHHLCACGHLNCWHILNLELSVIMCQPWVTIFCVYFTIAFCLQPNIDWFLVSVYVHVRYMLLPVHLSSVICNARAPYSGGWNFPQYFYGIWYLGHPLTCTEILRRSSQGNPSTGGVKHNRGSQIWRFLTYRRLYLRNSAR